MTKNLSTRANSGAPHLEGQARITLSNADLHPPIAQTKSLRGALRRLGKRSASQHFPVLTGIDLDIADGTRLGLIGPNGAGKSSLLRLLASVYEPTQGTIARRGRILTMFDLHFGMDDEASGYKNLEIAGALLGMRRRQVRDLVPEIEEFSELGEALSRPVKSYSSGMRVRLAYSLVTSLPADILLIDEIIGVGDAAFLKKARARMEDKLHDTKILVLASHADSVLQDFCTTGLVMDHGRIVFRGEIGEALQFYNRGIA
jgi:ABC-type polysaccharide/polyol phosphate transport system ATPase subunit